MRYVQVQTFEDEGLKVYHQMRDNAFDKLNSFVADSPKVVNILLQSDLDLISILATKEYYDEYESLINTHEHLICYLATKEQMQALVGHKIHHNCMLHGIRPSESPLSDLSNNIVMLDKITSNENVGSIARSMAGFGVGGYLLPKESPHPYGRRALRVSMGYMSHLKYHIYENIIDTVMELKKDGYKVYAAELTHNSIPLQEIKVQEKWVLIMGSEGQGISQEVLDVCDEIVSIEMLECVKSFNVSVAAAVLIYEFVMSG